MEGCDYSYQHPTVQQLVEADRLFVCRYLGVGGPGKALTPRERDELHAAGRIIVATFESEAERALDGRDAGVEDAHTILRLAEAIGLPEACPVYVAVDFDLKGQHIEDVRGYFTGLRSILGSHRIGVYGGKYAVWHAQTEHWCDWYWQTYAWSDGEWMPHVHLQQYHNGVTLGSGVVDLDRAMRPDFGGWYPSMVPHAATPAVAVSPATVPPATVAAGGDGQGVTPAEVAAVLAGHVDRLGDVVDRVEQHAQTIGESAQSLAGLQITPEELAAALATDPTFVTGLAAALAPYLAGAAGTAGVAGDPSAT